MKIFNWIAPIHQRDPLLFRAGLFLLILSILLFVPLLLDNREVMGINTWIKPMKFTISIGIFLWSIAWFLGDLSHGLYKWKKIISRSIFYSMIIEIGVILYQAGRAKQSHFNNDSLFDGVLFTTMGIMIGITTLAVVIILIFYLFTRPKIDFVYLTSVRIGLIVFLIASMVGGMMIGNDAHSVGVEDGGSGLPFVNWSTDGGDLRIAHFLGLHAIQIFPLFAWIVKKYSHLEIRVRMMLLLLFTLVFSSIWSYIMYNSMNGISIVDMF